MEKMELEALARRLNLTNYESEKEPYILTEYEANDIVGHEVDRKRKHYLWKFSNMGLGEQDIMLRLSTIDFIKEIDVEDVLQRANSMKHYEIWIKDKRDEDERLEKERLEEIKKRFTAKYVYNLIAWTSENVYGKKFILNEGNTEYVKAICFYISNDIRFETELNFSFNKGLMIRGISGLGKTYIPKCIENNELKPLKILSMIDISENVKETGDFSIYTSKIIYLDDVGTEEHNVNHFGTKINWFKNFIEMYYLQNKPFNKLIISTNCNGNNIEDKYGFRVRSRMREMFNVIDVKGNDMRV